MRDPSELILDAALLAASAHGAQRYGDKPYIVHPLQVAGQVSARGGSTEQVVAALLHDTLEDTDLDPRLIRLAFGGEVVGIVEQVTRRPTEDYPAFIERITGSAVLVKLCDLICNLDGLPTAEMSEGRREKLTARYGQAIAFLHQRLQADRRGGVNG